MVNATPTTPTPVDLSAGNLDITLPPDLMHKVATGERREVYLRLTPHWLSLLVETLDADDGQWRPITKDEAFRLSWPENRGMLQCSLSTGHHRLRPLSSVRLAFDGTALPLAVKGIRIASTPDGRYDVFAIRVESP